jgi:hypothetical protein
MDAQGHWIRRMSMVMQLQGDALFLRWTDEGTKT